MARPRTGLESVDPPAAATVASSRTPFVDIDTIMYAEGIGAVISQRRGNGIITFAIFRFFDRDGEPQRTGFIPEKHAHLIPGLVVQIQNRVKDLRAKGSLPFPEIPFAPPEE